MKPTLWEVTGDSSSFFTPCRFARVSRLYLSPLSGVRFPDNTSSSVAVCFDFAIFATLCSSSTFPLCLFVSAPLISPPSHSSFCIDCSPLPLFLVHLSTHAWPTISSCMSRMHFLSPKEKKMEKKIIIEASLRFCCLLISIPNRDGGIKIVWLWFAFGGGRMESFFFFLCLKDQLRSLFCFSAKSTLIKQVVCKKKNEQVVRRQQKPSFMPRRGFTCAKQPEHVCLCEGKQRI